MCLKKLGFKITYTISVLKYHRCIKSIMWGPDKDWQCYRCYSTYTPAEMFLNRERKKWYCSECIKEDVIDTPYILTKQQLEDISLVCKNCKSLYITKFKSKLETDKTSFICDKCKLNNIVNR